ncbi:MAG: hypothetical protein JSU94_02680 [Phycisphaerales bacterium]|nr:MAG: hypothetical protein JSU94_02680 [Phycisphaerales bacterium]
MQGSDSSGRFFFESVETEPVGSVLYEEHLKLADKSRLAPFAGFLMPLWYSSISAEHQAVRQAAGLFDCTHMGVLDVAGPHAERFLDVATTNKVAGLEVGRAQYGYILDAAGNVLDDIIIYRRAAEDFMVVVNAANEPKIKAYFSELTSGVLPVDADEPGRKLEHIPEIRDMRDTVAGDDCRVDIALQGPRSLEILLAVTGAGEAAERIEALRPFRLTEQRIGEIDCLISRTGYTGAKTGFELFVHPRQAARLWNVLLEKGAAMGLVPCGLGSRDSLRIEAGLPLYGHELAGRFNISPFEAGYGWAVKLQKQFFIGKAAMARTAETYDMKVARIELPGAQGVRPVRPNDAVLNGEGECIGWVLSCAKAGQKQFALAYVNRNAAQEEDQVGVYYLARNKRQVEQGRKDRVQKQQVLRADATGTVAARFAKF